VEVKGRLRILFVVPHASLGGHPYHAAIYETEALAKANQDVTLLTFAPVDYLGRALKVKLITVIGPEKGRLTRLLGPDLNRHPVLAYLLTLLAYLLTLLKVPKLGGRTGFDVVYLRDGDGFMILPQALGVLFGGRRWLISLLLTEERPTLLGRVFKSPLGARIFGLSFSKNEYGYVCQNQHASSYYSRRFLKGMLVDRVYLLPPLIQEPSRLAEPLEITNAKSDLGIRADQLILLSFGALHRGKDVDVVLNAMEAFPNLALVHAGQTHGRLRGMKNRHPGLRVSVIDSFIPEESKPTYFGFASAVILSYTKEFTGTASMLWEACRYRVPVIASDNEQLAELVSRYKLGVTFHAQDADSLKDAINRFLALTQEEKLELKRNCERFFHEFSSVSWADKFLQICGELSREKSSS
jgi:glycosyltransferase involved in cell wall biosynthesis